MSAAILPLHPAPAQPAAPKRPRPDLPYPDFPLFPHPNGQWCKKIRGRPVYFGAWVNPQAALNKFLDQRDDLYAGRVPRVHGDGLTLVDLCRRFLTHKKALLESGELKPRTYADYVVTCERLCKEFGSNRQAADLHPDDFASMRATWSRSWGPVTIANEIRRVRGVFRFGNLAGHIKEAIVYGPGFNHPSKKTLRLARAAKGVQMFEARELQRMLNAAAQPLKTMILLAINCGFGNNDCGRLPVAALELKAGWVNFPRPKTGIDRRCPLWPETIKALKEAIANRPAPRGIEAGGLVFVTKYGQPWAKEIADNPITKEMAKLLKELKIAAGRNFYALRHTFETVAGESCDQVAVDFIMGHARNDMATAYRERISDQRLRAVSKKVRKWLFGK